MALKILLVEDDNNLREIYEARLQAEGYTILTAKDGEEALVVAKAEKPELIISDVMMPRISGFEMLDILRNTEELKYTKVIMLTALGQAEDKTRANSLGADRYLVKSQVTLEDIVKAAHELTDPGSASSGAPQGPVPSGGPTQPPTAPPPTVDMPVQSPPDSPVSQPPDTPATAPPAQPATANNTAPIVTADPLQSQAAPAAASDPSNIPHPAHPPVTSPTATSTIMPPVPEASKSRPSYMTDFSAPAAQAIAQPATPTPAAQPAPAVQPEASQLNTETTEEEKAEVDKQIATFAGQEPSVVPPPAEQAVKDAPSVVKPQPDNSDKKDDELLAGAMDNLSNVTPQSLGSDSVTIANKKVIKPPVHDDKPSLNDLLAREEAKDMAKNNGIGPVANSPLPDQASTPAQPPEPGTPPQYAGMPAISGSPQTPPAQNSFDPNNIAL